MRHVKINDVVEQKLIPPLSKPKRPPTEAQIRAAQAMAEAYKIRKGILVTSKGPEVVKKPVMPVESEDDSTASQSPIRVKKEVVEEVEEQGQVYYVPSSPEGPSFYRGKPAELTTRQCRY